MNKSTILIESKLKNLESGFHLFTADFVSDNEGDRLEIKEFEFVKYLNKDTKIDIEINENSIPAEIFDIRFPKIHSKVDISYGFFTKKKDAADSFVKMINHIHKVVNSSYKKQFC
jgi:hypothetical protein